MSKQKTYLLKDLLKKCEKVYDLLVDYEAIDKHSHVFYEQEWHSINEKLGFIKNAFIAATMFVGFGALVSSNPFKCVSVRNQECKVRQAIVNINSNEFLFYPYSVLANKCSGSCNDINNP